MLGTNLLATTAVFAPVFPLEFFTVKLLEAINANLRSRQAFLLNLEMAWSLTLIVAALTLIASLSL